MLLVNLLRNARTCAVCRRLKKLTDFAKNGRQHGGRHPYCSPCRYRTRKKKAQTDESRKKHAEYERARLARLAGEQREQLLSRKRAEYIRNKPAHQRRAAAYRNANREKWIEYERRRRAHKKLSLCLPLTKKSIAQRFAVFGNACAYCGRTDLPLTVDHAKPIARGGPHILSNIRPACRPCNSRKNTKTISEFLR